MDKSKIIMNTVIGLMSLILVYVMFIQFRIVKETDTEGIEFMRETELKETLASYKTNYKEVEEELKDVGEKINEYKQNEKSEEATVALLETEIKDAKMKLGLTDVQGEGIIIEVKDTENDNVRYSDLLLLINELIFAGAEAISINGERIVAMSDIVNVWNFIQINGERKTSPFEIKAIGDTMRLQSGLSIKGGYIDTYDSLYSINVQTGMVTINKYNGKITLNYAKE